MSFSIVYVTHENLEAAQEIGNTLINEKLIACANYFPITSAYWWQGDVAREDEFVSILKTPDVNWAKVKSRVVALHPYSTPCVMRLQVEANDAYEDWIHSECGLTRPN